MRVLVDANLFIAYLLKPTDDSFINLLLNTVGEGSITLLMPGALLHEIEQTIRRKPHLNKRITETQLQTFTGLLQAISEEIPLIAEAIPRLTRDEKDDYLIAYAVVGQADYLISGDKDLLVLGKVQGVTIVDSGEFRQVLRRV